MNNYNDTMGKPHVTPAQWEQRRYEIAKDVLAGFCASNRGACLSLDIGNAIRFADELIKQLKDNGTLDGNNQ